MPYPIKLRAGQRLGLAFGGTAYGGKGEKSNIPQGFEQWFIDGEDMLMNGEIVIGKEQQDGV